MVEPQDADGGPAQRPVLGPVEAAGLALLLIATVLLITTLAWHFWTITRIRGRIRAGIAAASKGRTPICLRCGYDCALIEGDACPECGAALLVSDRNPGTPP